MALSLRELIKNCFSMWDIDLSKIRENIVLYGAGLMGEQLLRICRAQNIEPYICDGDPKKIGTSFYGIEIKEFEEVVKELNGELKVIICSIRFYEDIKRKLLKIVPETSIWLFDYEQFLDGIFFEPNLYRKGLEEHENELNNLYEKLEDEKSKIIMKNIIKGHLSRKKEYFKEIHSPDQYFPNNVILLSDNEVFVDGGAYNGDTLKMFFNKTNGKYEKIYSFEPTDGIFDKLEMVSKSLDNGAYSGLFGRRIRKHPDTVPAVSGQQFRH